MSKLQLIDSGKLNELLNALENDRKEKRMLEGILDPNLHGLRESMVNMNNKKNDIEQREVDTVHFLKKKKKYKDSKPPEEGGGGGVEEEEKEKAPSKMVESSEKIEKFIHEKKMHFTNFTNSDLIYDLSHGGRSVFNLPPGDQEAALIKLKSRKMPANYIFNRTLKSKYVKITPEKIKQYYNSLSTTPSTSYSYSTPSGSTRQRGFSPLFPTPLSSERNKRREK